MAEQSSGWQKRAERPKQFASGTGYSLSALPGLGPKHEHAVERFLRTGGRSGNGRANGSTTHSTGAGLAAGLGFSISPELGGAESVTKPYAENVWVRAAVKARARAFADLILWLWDRDPADEQAQVIEDHPLYTRLASPNPLHTLEEFWLAHATAYSLDGESYWFLMDDQGRPLDGNGAFLSKAPTTILPVRGSITEITLDARGFPEKYRYSGSRGSSDAFPALSVIPFVDHDPYDPTRGLGDTEVALRQVELMHQAERYLDATIRHGGDHGAWITFEQRLGVDELERRQEKADEDGEVQNAGRYTVLDEGAKVTPKPASTSLTDYPEFFRHFIQSILSAHGVTPPIVGIFDDAAYNNIETAHREFWTGQNGVLAFAGYTARTIKARLLARLARVTGWEVEAYPAFSHDHIEVLKPQLTEQVKAATTTASAGIGVSFNEVLELQGAQAELPESGNRHLLSGMLIDEDAPSPKVAPKEEKEEDSAGLAGTAGDLSEPQGGGGLDASPAAHADAKTGVLRPLRVPDAKLLANVTHWLASYERAQIKRLRAIAKGSVAEAAREVQIAVSEEDLKLIDLAEKAWSDALKRGTGTRLQSIYKTAAAEIAGDLGVSMLGLTNPAVIRKFAEHLVMLAEGATSTLALRMRSIVLRVLAEDVGGPAAIRELIRRNLPELEGAVAKAFATKEQRAAMIARTETNWARTNGAQDQAIDAGARWIEWHTSRDSAVRPTHQANNGVRIPVGQKFSNGLTHPHMPGAPASEVVGCRCGAIYVM